MTTRTKAIKRLNPNPNDSIYVKRLDTYLDNWYNGKQNFENPYHTRWYLPNGTMRLDHLVEIEIHGYTFEEMQVGGFQLVIKGFNFDMRDVLDSNGLTITQTYVSDSEVTSLGEPQNIWTYSAFVYRIGTDYDTIPQLMWESEYAMLSNSCASLSKEKTLKLINKKLDIYNRMLSNVGRLIELSRVHAISSKLEMPYNCNIGDEVWIRAFGRNRQGIVVGTTGSRFVVGYLTPSNPKEFKYKLLPLIGLKVKK